MENRRVVITGRGVCLPNANNSPNNVKVMMDNLYNGRSSIENVSARFPWLQDYYSQLGFLFKDFKFDAEKIGIRPKDVKRLGPSVIYSFEAGHEAIMQSGFLDAIPEDQRDRVGVIIGHGLCGIIEVEEQYKRLVEKGISKVNLNLCLKSLPDSSAGFMSIRYGLRGPCFSVSTACATAKTAIRLGMNSIRSDETDVAVCGATCESSASIIYAGFGQMGANSARANDPLRASRPFDRDRDGFIIAEGAGIVVLEELEHAKRRNATIYGEIIGYGANSDGHHETAPRTDAEYISRAMKSAIKMARINPEQIGYINAHGTSTPNNDGVETLGIKKVFGDYAYRIPVSSTKSNMGHLLSACGGVELIIAMESARYKMIPPTLNCDNPDTDVNYHSDPKRRENFLPCDLDYVPNVARAVDFDIAMSNSFGFLGHNESMIVRV